MNKRILKSLGLVAISSLFAVILAESLLHAFPSLLPVEVRQALNDKGRAHPVIGNLPQSNSSGAIVTRDFESPYQLDNNGFRNDGDWPENVDIAVIGDSLVFGYGVDVESAWPQRLTELTDQSVINLGLIGASPQHSRKIHEVFARPLKPEIIVFGFFARNDFWDADKYARWEQSGVGGNYLEWRGFGSPTAEEYSRPIYRILYAIRKRSYVLALVKFGRDALSGKKRVQPSEISLASGAKMLLHGNDFERKTLYASPGNEVFDRVVDELRRLRDATLSDGSRLIVLLQPAKEEVYRETEGAILPDASVGIRASLKQLQIEYVDATANLRRRAESGEELYFPTDGHPNAQGYAAFAELLADYLESSRVSEIPR